MKTNIAKAIVSYLSVIILPDYYLIAWLILAMVLDFITGVLKSRILRESRGADGYRKSSIKAYQYFGLIAVGIVIANVAPMQQIPGSEIVVTFFTKWLIIFLIWTELLSICENLYKVEKTSLFAKRIVKPLINLLTFQIKNNPATADQTGTNEKEIL